MQGGEIFRTAKAFCEAPANPSCAEQLELSRRTARLDGWLQHWPPAWKDFAGDAWQAMHNALQAQGDIRRAHAAVLETYLDRLSAARRAAARPSRKPSRLTPRPEELPPQWWQRD